MNKADLAEILSSKAEIPKIRASHFINILTDAIREELADGGRVTISDFGTFTVSQRRAFTGQNPKTGVEIQIPSRRIPVFRAGRGMKNALNN
jgi:nucleoid DNA-binding protein